MRELHDTSGWPTKLPQVSDEDGTPPRASQIPNPTGVVAHRTVHALRISLTPGSSRRVT